MQFSHLNKFLVSLVGTATIGASLFLGADVSGTAATMVTAISALSSLFVYAVPNFAKRFAD